MKRSRRVDARRAFFGRVAADALVHDVPGNLVRVELALQIVWKALAFPEAVTGAEAIAKDQQNLAIVGRGQWRRRSGWCCAGRLRLLNLLGRGLGTSAEGRQ